MDISSVSISSIGNSTTRTAASSNAVQEGTRQSGTQDSSQKLQDLKKTDAAVRQHEQAHLAAAGGLAQSGASFTYTRGPDGQQYAIGGEVSIDVSPAATPTATIAKAQQIRSAALAPADPSAQDRSVAAQANQLELQARMELAQQQAERSGQSTSGKSGPASLYQHTAQQTGTPMNSLIAVA